MSPRAVMTVPRSKLGLFSIIVDDSFSGKYKNDLAGGFVNMISDARSFGKRTQKNLVFSIEKQICNERPISVIEILQNSWLYGIKLNFHKNLIPPSYASSVLILYIKRKQIAIVKEKFINKKSRSVRFSVTFLFIFYLARKFAKKVRSNAKLSSSKTPTFISGFASNG